jgi:hypothetical protein
MSNNNCTCFEPIWHEGKCTLCGGIDKTPIIPTQLPAEVAKEVAAQAEELTVKLGWVAGAADQQDTEGACIIIATEYATKAYQARALLEKFISRHEAGLLPDRFIYNEIKTFLDGK